MTDLHFLMFFFHKFIRYHALFPFTVQLNCQLLESKEGLKYKLQSLGFFFILSPVLNSLISPLPVISSCLNPFSTSVLCFDGLLSAHPIREGL